MLGQQSSIRVMDANHVTENSFTEGHVAESNNDQVNCTPNAPASFVPLEDCKCPICLDYFIDVPYILHYLLVFSIYCKVRNEP